MYVCKCVSRSGSLLSQSAVLLECNIGDATLACQRESLWGFVESISSTLGTPTMGDPTIPAQYERKGEMSQLTTKL